MRRSVRRRETPEVSLFPFLAVLICTFGVLFILLVLAVKAADESAKKANEIDRQKVEKQIDELNSQLDLELVRSAGLSEVRPELVERLRGVRDIRTHLENEIARLNEQAVIIARQLERQDEVAHDIKLESIHRQVAELEIQLATAVAELEQKQKQVGGNQPVMYSIVPYNGASGELRIPIYIECRENKLIIQPHDVVIEVKDFAVPVTEQNPLDAALVAVREYYLRYDLNVSVGSPYPLLVVRPDGAESYSRARHAMRGWDDEFGYELISEKKKLDFGESDKQLAEAVRKAVEQSIREQHKLMDYRLALNAAKRRQEPIAIAPGLRASSQYGGFVNQAGEMGGGPSTGQASRHAGDQAARGKGFSRQENAGQEGGQDGPESQPSGKGNGTSLALQRGENWALPSMTAGAVGYRRPIRVYCSNDEITFETKSQSTRRVRVKIGTNMVLAVDTMVDEIWRMIESWGVTGANGYWIPELRFTVAPGSESRMKELLWLLEGSGLAIEGAD